MTHLFQVLKTKQKEIAMTQTQLTETLKKLKLTTIVANFQEIARRSQEKNQTYEQFLWELVQWEAKARHENRVNLLLKQAKAPIQKTLSSFNFTARQGITQGDIEELAKGDWVRKGHNTVLFGGFGVGKTHLALGILRALCQEGFHCYFSSVAQLMNMLVEEKRNLGLSKLERKLDKFDLIVCDELGYVSASPEGAELFFQLIAQRYERKSLLITTNLAFSQWDNVFQKTLMTQAALDRVLHHCKTFNINGHSQRAQDAGILNPLLTP
jgi:DNA replication protein DnaC